MASDRSRLTYDPNRKWRGLIAQQGRVTLEADWNESAAIDDERDRLLTLDFVGPIGTPGQPSAGYTVTGLSLTEKPQPLLALSRKMPQCSTLQKSVNRNG